MLLTKPLTTLLTSSLTPTLTTLLLITPSGQLLASASSLPSSILRSRATLAMSIWEVYQENGGAVEAALPETQTEGQEDGAAQEGGSEPGNKTEENKIQTITLQLTIGILTIRKLSCGLLVMGMSDSTVAAAAVGCAPTPTQPMSYSGSAGRGNGPSNQGSLRGKGKLLATTPPSEGIRSYAGSEAGSIGTLSGRGREVQTVRKGTEQACGWLERELVGFKVGEGI